LIGRALDLTTCQFQHRGRELARRFLRDVVTDARQRAQIEPSRKMPRIVLWRDRRNDAVIVSPE